MRNSPGPWCWGDGEPVDPRDWPSYSLSAADGPMGFYDEGPDSCGGSPENTANRALIAAAPEMLELLRTAKALRDQPLLDPVAVGLYYDSVDALLTRIESTNQGESR